MYMQYIVYSAIRIKYYFIDLIRIKLLLFTEGFGSISGLNIIIFIHSWYNYNSESLFHCRIFYEIFAWNYHVLWFEYINYIECLRYLTISYCLRVMHTTYVCLRIPMYAYVLWIRPYVCILYAYYICMPTCYAYYPMYAYVLDAIA